MRVMAAGFLLGALLAAAAGAQSAGQPGAAVALESLDSSGFATQATMAGMMEVEAGRMALQQSQDPAIRSFATRMIEDHGKANAELAELCKRRNISLPPRIQPPAMDVLANRSGATFDRIFALESSQQHTKAIALFTSAARSSRIDADLRDFAKRTLPVLQKHLHMADDIARKQAGVAPQNGKQEGQPR